MSVIKLNEDDTTSSSRIFIKILWQVRSGAVQGYSHTYCRVIVVNLREPILMMHEKKNYNTNGFEKRI